MNMRMVGRATLFVLSLIALPSVLNAQQLQKQKQLTLKEAVDICIVIVRKQTEDEWGLKIGQFDAYIRADGQVSYFGNNKERFSFQKCLDEKGHPLNLKR
jgi:hypothetical protein